MTVLLDFESRSRAKLREIGGRNYWADPSTEPLCCCWYDVDQNDVGVWHPGQPWPFDGRLLAAHNMSGFDRFAVEAVTGRPLRDWIDTSELARTAGLPGALDTLGTRWYGIPKDREGNRLTVGLSTVRRPPGKDGISAADWGQMTPDERRTRGVQQEITPEILARVVQYCLSDVEIMAEAWPVLESWAALEPDVVTVDRAVNDRGVALDTDLCLALLTEDERLTNEAVEQAAREMPLREPSAAELEIWQVACEQGRCEADDVGPQPRFWTSDEVRAAASSPAQFCEIVGTPDAKKATVADVDHPLVRARQALASIARGKLRAGLARVSPDGRLRDTHWYYGGHTGRWSGRGMQLQNLPRPDDRFEKWSHDDLHRSASEVRNGRVRGLDRAEIDLLLRACLWAPSGRTLVVCDFAGVEARALAWCADDRAALEIFASGADPYLAMASVIFGEPVTTKGERRTVGKIAELACGYGMGGVKFNATAATAGVDLAAVGVQPAAVVKAWRRRHAPVVRFWYAAERAWARALDGHAASVDRFTFESSDDGRDVIAWLPSGRPIVYNDARVGLDGGLSYHGTKAREHLYGGKIVENLIQAMCRDLLADALVRTERAGLTPVMHVHDEIVCEVDEPAGAEAYRELHSIMTTLPEWAVGFPIGADGFIGRRYRK